MTEGSDIQVFTGVHSSKFHTSENCAPSAMRRAECSLREAVEANRNPCGNCVDDETREVYWEVLDDV